MATYIGSDRVVIRAVDDNGNEYVLKPSNNLNIG